jgi:hypothetical protein
MVQDGDIIRGTHLMDITTHGTGPIIIPGHMIHGLVPVIIVPTGVRFIMDIIRDTIMGIIQDTMEEQVCIIQIKVKESMIIQKELPVEAMLWKGLTEQFGTEGQPCLNKDLLRMASQ